MIQRDLIERVPGPGRAVHHRLTEKGTELRQVGDQVVDGVLRQSFAALTPPQLETFGDLLARLLAQPFTDSPS